MTYLGDRPLLVQLQAARMDESTAERELADATWWRKPALWSRWVGHNARADGAWAALSDQDWDAITVAEIRTVASRYWRDNGLHGNPFHPRARARVDDVVDAVARQPEWELRVPDRRVIERLAPVRARTLYLAEISRLQDVAADPVMLAQDRPLVPPHGRDHPGLRELVVQHRASGLRASFFYGGRDHTKVGWVVSKTYSIDSIDPARVETSHSRGSAWSTYVGLGIGTKIYVHAGEALPEVRWADKSVSPSGKGVRRKMHTLDPWRWQLNDCRCSAGWDTLTRTGAPPCPSH